MPCYLIRCGETDKVKIGWALDVPSRVAMLQTGSWESLHLLRTWDGHQPAETWLHRRFADLHIVREWFTFTPEMLSVEPPVVVQAPRGKKIGDKDSIKRIVATFGSQLALARAVAVSRTIISWWIELGVPPGRIPAIIEAAAKLDPPVELTLSDFFSTSPVPERETA